MKFPKKSMSEVEVLEKIREITKEDGLVRKINGGILGMVSEPSGLALKLYSEFLETNYLYGSAIYPGIVRLEREAISMLADFCGCEKATGDIVSGGSAANILAEKAARDKAKKENPNVVIPATAHPSLIKGCHLLRIEARTIPCDEKTHKAIPQQMEKAIDDNTIMIVGCLGDPMWGAIDPISEIAEIAVKRGIHMHVDAAWGGFIIPFLRELGYLDVSDWDFRVEGVSSITIDPHKLLFVPMPAGGILYRNEEIREYAHSNIGDYLTTGLVGSRSGAPIVCLWMLLKTNAYEGYLKSSEKMMQITKELVRKVCKIPGIENEMDPNMNLVAFLTNVDGRRVSEEMGKRGWKGMYATKEAIRCIVLPYMEMRISNFVKDLREVIESLNK